LHAIKEEYVEAVELLLEWEETHHQPGTPYVSLLFSYIDPATPPEFKLAYI
jgi:hypothetical protein